MPTNDQKITIPANLSQDELTKRVAERVMELMKRDLQNDNERRGKKQGR